MTWLVTAPTGFDSENNRSLAENPDEGGWLSGVEFRAPLLLRLRATLTPTDEWIDLEPEELTLSQTEQDRRMRRSREAELEALEQFKEARGRRRNKKGQDASVDDEDESPIEA